MEPSEWCLLNHFNDIYNRYIRNLGDTVTDSFGHSISVTTDLNLTSRYEADQFIVKDKIIHAKYYRMDRELLETYQDGKVTLRINEQELKSKYEKDSPGYFSYGA